MNINLIAESFDFKTQFEFIHFDKIEDKPKTSVWNCVNNKSGTSLGIIKWYAQWRQYCFFPSEQTIFSLGCLKDITTFIEQLKAK